MKKRRAFIQAQIKAYLDTGVVPTKTKLKADAKAAGFDPATWLMIIQMILELIKKLKNPTP